MDTSFNNKDRISYSLKISSVSRVPKRYLLTFFEVNRGLSPKIKQFSKN